MRCKDVWGVVSSISSPFVFATDLKTRTKREIGGGGFICEIEIEYPREMFV